MGVWEHDAGHQPSLTPALSHREREKSKNLRRIAGSKGSHKDRPGSQL